MAPLYIALICVGAALALALLVAFALFSNNSIVITRHTLEDPKIENDLRVVQLSDLHGKSFGRGNARLIKKVAAEKPGLIVITGDIIHKYRERDIKVALALIKELAKLCPVYYVSGNHEMRSTKYRSLCESLKEAGALVLDDTSVEFAGITFAGVNCASIKRGGFYNLAEGNGYKVLLAHLPQYIDKYAMARYDAVLCGHAHGGQWRIPFTKVGFYSPGQGLFPKYNSGVHICGSTKEIISRGLGNSECPLRLFNRPEIVVVDFKKQ